MTTTMPTRTVRRPGLPMVRTALAAVALIAGFAAGGAPASAADASTSAGLDEAANCHGAFISGWATYGPNGIGNIIGGAAVQDLQAFVRQYCDWAVEAPTPAPAGASTATGNGGGSGKVSTQD
jgi:hypothetical protein